MKRCYELLQQHGHAFPVIGPALGRRQVQDDVGCLPQRTFVRADAHGGLEDGDGLAAQQLSHALSP